MFIPVHDINPLKKLSFQWVTVALIAFNILSYLLFGTPFFSPASEYVSDFALVPMEFLGGSATPSGEVFRLHEPLPLPEAFTILSYMFVHVDFFHLVGNMVFLWVFGDNIEDAMGRLRFLFFYLTCGILAALVHVVMMPDSNMPVVGASGAVAGVIGAYLMLHPKVKLWVLVLYRVPIRITAAWAIGFWLAVQIYTAFYSTDIFIAWGAHLGGFAVGMVLVLFMRRPGVELFDRNIGKA